MKGVEHILFCKGNVPSTLQRAQKLDTSCSLCTLSARAVNVWLVFDIVNQLQFTYVYYVCSNRSFQQK